METSAELGLGEFLERVLLLGRDPHERLRTMSKQARANEVQFLEHLILRAKAIWNFQPLELPAIVADLRNAA